MRDIRQPLVGILSAISGLELAYVFGSYAPEPAGPDSDIDIAVPFPRALTLDQKLQLIERITDELD